jgi:DNA-directed RNA polymerase beta' subunit
MTHIGNNVSSLVFTGDEMNIHAPQSYEAEAELRMISATALNIITAQESKPIITITQDSLIAAYLMTRKKFTLSSSQFNNICMRGERSDGGFIYDLNRMKRIERVLKMNGKKFVRNGRLLISLILPEDFIYEKNNGAHQEEPVVKIKEGVFLEGALDKSTLGSAHGSIIQVLNKEYGSEITANFIDNIQFFGNEWLMVHGFSVGLEDCMITSEHSVKSIKNKLAECYTKAQGIEETTQNPGIKEVRITAALSQAKDIGMKIAKEAMRKENNFLVTVTSGAKGDYFNISQITGLLGQQNLEGKRVNPNISHKKRTLPHYPLNANELDKEREYESRGFIRHSFIRGLNPQEFFFHAMSGREGVADTAMGTAKSGYIQRKIVKVLEDVQVRYDKTVRDTTGKIYQFCYGDNGYDATKTVPVDDAPNSCNVKRLTERLNLGYELGIKKEIKDNKPEIIVEEDVVYETKEDEIIDCEEDENGDENNEEEDDEEKVDEDEDEDEEDDEEKVVENEDEDVFDDDIIDDCDDDVGGTETFDFD